jgi:septal ring factor EnvC (AmiA/AmiB activator)
MDTPLTGQVPETPTEQTTTDGQAPQGEQPDIEALLKEVKTLRKEAASWRTKLRATEEAEEQRKRAEMTELDKLRADLEAERQARTVAEEQRRQQVLRTQVISAAARMGLNDPEDAVRMLDTSDLEIDDQGQINGLEREMSKLLAAKPYLAKQTGTISPTNPAGGAPGQSDAERLKRIYGLTGKSTIFGGPGGGVVWNTKE